VLSIIHNSRSAIFENKPVIPTLLQLAELVSGIVETLSAYFLVRRI
jgi:hypothetical protein